MASHGHSSSPSLSARATTSNRSESEDPSRSHCTCDNGDRPGKYVLCDNDDCKVGWYHWECVGVMKKPVGTWLCPSCSPNPAFYAKQLGQIGEARPPVPKAEKADEPAGPRVRQQEQEREQVSTVGIREKAMAKKGVAAKRPAAPKPKPRWVGWVELSSEGEEAFKKRVDAQWSDDVISGTRRRASKTVGGDNETGSRTLRRHSRVGERNRIVEMDSDENEGESVHQPQEQEAEEEEEQQQQGPVHRKASVIDISSEDSDNSEYAMDVDASADDADEDSAEGLSDPHLDSGRERHNSLDPIRTVSAVEAEDLEDSEDMEYQDKSNESSSSHASDVSEYVDANEYIDDNEAPEASRTHVSASHGREVAVSPVVKLSERASRRADPIDVDAENHDHEVQELDAVSPAVESNNRAPLYQRQGNCWGEFPESAIRSTLPRLA